MAVRQENGKAMGASLGARDWGWDAASCRNTLETRAAYHGWRKEDDPLAVPGAATSVRGIAQVLDRAASDGDFL